METDWSSPDGMALALEAMHKAVGKALAEMFRNLEGDWCMRPARRKELEAAHSRVQAALDRASKEQHGTSS